MKECGVVHRVQGEHSKYCLIHHYQKPWIIDKLPTQFCLNIQRLKGLHHQTGQPIVHINLKISTF